MSDLLNQERDGGVVRVKLNRPEKRNALSGEVWEALYEKGQELLADESIRVVIMGGEGKAFCAGIDLSSFGGGMLSGGGGGGGDSDAGNPVANLMRMQDSFSWLERGHFASIAAVHGYALGAGWQLALACDFTIAAEGTTFGLLETNYGLVPDMGGTVRLTRSVGVSKAKELILRGKRITAEEAQAIGAVAEVVPEDQLESAVRQAADDVLGRSPTAIRLAKNLVSKSAARKTSRALKAEAVAQIEAIASADFTEAISAFMQKRDPKFGSPSD